MIKEKFTDVRDEIMEIFKPFYEEYTTGPNAISTDGMAISLETAVFMYYLCNKYKFKKLMDRGSGFSSFVLRKYADEQDFPVIVYSIDNSEEWLNKTRDFLHYNELNEDNLLLWDELYKKYKGKLKFDFILEDAKYKLRKQTPNQVTSFLNLENGIMLWDDAKSHSGLIGNQAEKLKMKRYNVKEQTIDDYGRYTMITTRKELKEFEKLR